MNTQHTAAGVINVLAAKKSALRGGTTVWLGMLPDGRYVVTSRFQWECRTKNYRSAMQTFTTLCGE